LPKAISLFDDELEPLEPVLESNIHTPNIVYGKIVKITEYDLIEKLRSIMEAKHLFEALKVAEQYYKGKYTSMKPKDWLLLVKTIDFTTPQAMENSESSSVAAEPLNKYSTSVNSNQDDFVLFMQNSGLSSKSINNYLVALSGRLCSGIITHLYPDLKDIFLINDIALLSDWCSKLFKIPEYAILDSTGKNMYSCALKKYIQFVEIKGSAISKNTDESYTIHETPKSNELRFVQYLLNKGLSENSAKYYANAMGGKVADCIRENVDSDLHNIYSVSDYNTVFDWSLSLYRTSQFKELDNKGNRQYSCALKHYLEYLYSTNSMDVDVFQDDSDETYENGEYQSGKKKSYILRVTYPNGRIVEERVVSKTLLDVVTSAGAERVKALGIMLNGANLVSNTVIPRYSTSQKPIGNNLYVMTCCDTVTKHKIIDQISESLNLNLKVERVSIV